MKDYFEQSIRAFQLAGMSERTQECYTRAVRILVDYYGKTPEQITEPEVEDYFLHRRNVSKWSAATLRIAYSGIKFFFVHVLKREWHILTYLKAKREQRLPCILSIEEVFSILNHLTTFQSFCLPFHHLCLWTQDLGSPCPSSLRYRRKAHDNSCSPG